MRILLVSDIHGNFPALQAVADKLDADSSDLIINTGDSTVYAPFANQTLDWLRQCKAVSILGNTDIKIKKLLKGKGFKKPSKPEKKIMYTSTAESLSPANQNYLFQLKKKSVSPSLVTVSAFSMAVPKKPMNFSLILPRIFVSRNLQTKPTVTSSSPVTLTHPITKK